MAPQRIAIIGSTGQLGTDLVEVLRQDDTFDVMPLRHGECDCTRPDQLREVLRKLHPDTVINCAAYVRVDDCEDQPDEAFRVNAIGALNVARACAEIDALCVYVSTDYVFDGAKATPYVESDPACPVNVYGASKLAGEHLVRQAAPRWLIVRVASLFGKSGARGKGGNFVETILGRAKAGEPLTIVNDVRMSPTYTRDAATALVGLVEAGTEGIVHLSNDGACTWYEFAKQILDLTGVRGSIDPVSSKEYPRPARRPNNSALQGDRSPVRLRTWQQALIAYLIEKGHLSAGLAVTAGA
jgi:dTDP-4-dehydrorhamnose reductase